MNPDILVMLWKMSLQTAIVAAIVWVVCKLAPKAPASWRCALWLLVIVKLFIPPFAYLPAQLAIRQQPEPAMTQPMAMSDVAPLASEPTPNAPHAAPVEPIRAMQQPTATAATAVPAPVDPSKIALLVWLSGFLGMAGLIVLRFSRQRRLVADSSRAGDELPQMLTECAEKIGIRRLPQVRLSGAAQTPMLVGTIRPVILLPEGIFHSCSDANLRAMLLHELAHIKRRDIPILWLQQIAQALFFFHPAVWLAGRGIRRERELACDELVLSRSGIAPKDYAAGYISALKLANGRPTIATSLAMAEPFDLEKRRLQGILDRPVPKLSAPWLIALLTLIAISLPTFVDCSKPTAVKYYSTRQQIRVMAGLTPVQGPGVVVTLRDSPRVPKNASPGVATHYIAYDGYIRDVVNQLWSAGAKAISINGQRIVGTTAIRAAGQMMFIDEISKKPHKGVGDPAALATGRTVFINGISKKPPYVIKAVGDSAALAAYLGSKGGIGERLKLLGMIRTDLYSRVEVPPYHPQPNFGSSDPALLAGTKTLAGPGIVVTLHGRPKLAVSTASGAKSNYVIYDRDITAVINELWAAGAQAISVNDHRWVTGSVVTFQDGAVYFGSAKLTAPYTIRAVGDAHALNRALNLPGSPAEGLQIVGMIDIAQKQNLHVPAYGFSTAAKRQTAARVPVTGQNAKVMAGLTPVEGPGIVVTLKDSPKRFKKTSAEVWRECIVHDIDIREVVNQLWAAGAKAISINGQRIVASSYIIATGRSIGINSVALLHPFVIQAVGDPKALAAPLQNKKNGIASGFLLLDMMTITQQPNVEVPAYRPAYTAYGEGKLDPKVMAGLTDVAGPGIVATLHDSPKRPQKATDDVLNQYKVHDRDIREIVNLLWAAGAQAISVNDQRWVTNSSVQFRSGAVYVNSVKLTAPFVIKAVSTLSNLDSAINLPGGPAEGLFLLDMLDVKQQSRVEVPAYRHATAQNAAQNPASGRIRPPKTNGYPPAAKVNSVHLRMTQSNPGEKGSAIESWMLLPHKERIEYPHQTFIYDGHHYWLFDRRNKHYQVHQYSRTQQPLEVDKWSTPAGVEKMWRNDGSVVRKDIRKNLHGVEQDAIELDITPRQTFWAQKVTVVMFLDPNTQRIGTITWEFYDGHGKLLRTKTDEYEYNTAMDAKLFTFHPPAGAKLVRDITKP